jgi:CRP-like cAMP-binding protein
MATSTNGDELRVPKGTVIFRQGDPGEEMFVISAGRVRLTLGSHGHEKELAVLGAGDFFGEMCLVEPARRCATVLALESTMVFRLPNQAVHRLAETDPVAMNALLAGVIRTLSERLRRMNDMLAGVGELSDWLRGSLV